MSLVQFTAKRSLYGSHTAEALVTVPLEVETADIDVSDIRTMERSKGGGMEVLFERSDMFWRITFAPVCGYEFLQLREFLDSTESGEPFRIWLRDESSVPLILKRLDTGHDYAPFMRTGVAERDTFRATITALQTNAPATEATPGVASASVGGGGGNSGDEETVDIYAPAVGGALGVLDPGFTGGPFTIVPADCNPLALYGIVEHGFYAAPGVPFGSLSSNGTPYTIKAFTTYTNGGLSRLRLDLGYSLAIPRYGLHTITVTGFASMNFLDSVFYSVTTVSGVQYMSWEWDWPSAVFAVGTSRTATLT
jgi:hypothetical protein